MKCYLNGGLFDESFLEKWHETANLNDEFLRSMLIDLKKYFKENIKGTPYFSLREMASKYGIKENQGNRNYKQLFMTSFRIIAYQEGIERHQNILIPRPTFRIEYTIDMMPDYKEYIENYLKEHGHYPEEYRRLRQCYEAFAEEIKNKLPQLPFCKPFFQLLEVTTSLSYFYATLNEMGKKPVFSSELSDNSYVFPKALPPIPVRYHHTYPMSLLLSELLQRIQKDNNGVNLDKQLAQYFNKKHLGSIPPSVTQLLRQTISTLMKEKLSTHIPVDSKTELNEDEVERIVQEASACLRLFVSQMKAGTHQVIKKYQKRMPEQKQKELSTLDVPNQLLVLKTWMQERVNHLELRWKTNPELVESEFIDEIPDEQYQELRNQFKQFVSDLKKNIEQTYNELSSKIIQTKEQNLKEIDVLIQNQQKELDKVTQLIPSLNEGKQKKLLEVDAHFNTLLQQLNQQATQALSQLNAALVSNNQAKAQYQQTIVQQQQHLATQQTTFNKLPHQAQKLNQAIMNQLVQTVSTNITQLNQAFTNVDNKNGEINKEITRIQQELVQKTTSYNQSWETAKVQVNTITQQELDKINSFIVLAQDKMKQLKSECSNIEVRAEEKLKELPQMQAKDTLLVLSQNAILNIKSIYEKEINRLELLLQNIEKIGQIILTIPELANLDHCKNYVHTLIGFTNKNLADQTGDTFRVIGGCGLSLPNMQSKPLIHADQVIQEVDKIEEFGQFEINGQSYVALRIPVIDRFDDELILSDEDDLELIELKHDKDGATVIHYAAGHLPLDEFIKILKDPKELNVKDHQGYLPIHVAARQNNEAVLRHIILNDSSKLQCDAKSFSGETPLLIAVEHSNIEVIKTLLGLGANPNHRLSNGLFPLYLAVQNNHAAVAMLLLDQPAIVVNTCLDNGMTPLHKAIENELEQVVLKLIEKGASLDARRKSDGLTPFHLAVQKGNLKAVQAMLARGVLVNLPLESGKTALHLAAAMGYIDIVTYLLSKGATIDAKTSSQETALMLAIQSGQMEVAYLLAKTAALNTVNRQGENASLLALKSGMPMIADLLLERGENSLLKDNQGHDCLYYLVRNGDYQRYTQLNSKAKWNINAEYEGQSLLAIAAQRGHFLMVYALLDEGAVYKNTNKTIQLIHYAVMANETSYVREWLQKKDLSSGWLNDHSLAYLAAQHGADAVLDLFLKTMTPEEVEKQELLSAAIESGQVEIVERVLKKTKNLQKKLDKAGNTALDLAVKSGNLELVALLLEQGCEPRAIFDFIIEREDKEMFELLLEKIPSKDWPLDLGNKINLSKSMALIKLFEQYKGFIVNSPVLKNEENKPVNPPKSDTLPQSNSVNSTLVEFKELIADCNFDAAAELLESNGTLQSLILKDLSINLMVYLFEHIDVAIEILGETATADNLLRTLQKIGFNPALTLGRHNVLSTLITNVRDEVVAYRLRLLTTYFPDSLTTLIHDEVIPGVSMVQMILQRGKIKLFEQLSDLSSKLSPNHSDSLRNKYSPLHEAARADNYEVVQFLLKTTTVDQFGQNRETAFMLAAANNNVRMMELLLRHGANPDQTDRFGRNALHYAINGKHVEASAFLIPLIRNKNRPDRDGLTPLMLASAKGLINIVRRLCSETMDTEQVTKKGFNALHLAAIEGHEEVVTHLVNSGYQIDKPESPSAKNDRYLKRTALHLAAQHGKVGVVVRLIHMGASIDYADVEGNTVCEHAVMSNDPEMLQFIQQVPVFHQKDHDKKLVEAASRFNNDSLLNEFILDDVPLGFINDKGYSPLHLAAIQGADKAAEVLLTSSDLDSNPTDSRGNTPLHFAAEFGHVRMITLLESAGALVDAENNQGETPLFLACKEGNLGAVVKLLHLGANEKLCNKEGVGPLQIASRLGHREIIKRLENPMSSLSNDFFFFKKCKLEDTLLNPVQQQTTYEKN
ncbi:ankyrin repeat domain-containing protein [Legionella sp. W05-934-2]